jgi:hypothetical protein
MLLCSKCHQTEATIHFTTVVDGVEKENVHFCKACAPSTGYEGLSVEEIKALSIIGKKCEFCEEDAFSGVREPENTIYWCHDCGLERGRIISGLLTSEHPEWKQRFALGLSGLSADFKREFTDWALLAGQKAVRILRDRKQQGG